MMVVRDCDLFGVAAWIGVMAPVVAMLRTVELVE